MSEVESENRHRTKISFVPHHGSLTECTQLFKRVCDGFAEFFDNSIQACNRLVDDPEYVDCGYIRLTLHICKRTRTGHAVIYDNGCGMDHTDVNNFASLSLNHEKRIIVAQKKNLSLTNHSPRHDNDAFLSKFGVGAKHAGFYLGDRIRLITRKANSSSDTSDHRVDDDKLVKEFTFDNTEMNSKFNESGNTADAYDGYILSRGVEDFDKCPPPSDESEFPELKKELQEHEHSYKHHFTIIVIKLKPTIILEFLDKHGDGLTNLRNDLCNIYNFHINPNLQFNQLRKSDKKITDLVSANKRKISTPAKKHSNKPKKTRISSSSQIATTGDIDDDDYDDDDVHNIRNELDPDSKWKSVNISFHFSVNSDFLVSNEDLSNCDGNYFKSCIENACSGLAFNLIIPDPDYRSDNNLTEVCTKEHDVSVVLLYFPFKEGVETKPPYLTGSSSCVDVSAGTSSSSTVVVFNDEPQDDVFNVFWLNRLVPETTLNTLPFFPASGTKLISDKWKHRLKGFMFLNRTFEKLSNNKLRLTVSDFSKWLNDKKVWEMVRGPKDIKDTFVNWLRRMRKDHDQDFELMTRDRMYELNNNAGTNNKSYFSDLKIGNSSFIKKDDIVKFNLSKKSLHQNGAGTSSSSSSSRPNGGNKATAEVFGRIITYEVNERLPSDCNHSKPMQPFKIRYIRVPTSVFGDEDFQTFSEAEICHLTLTDDGKDVKRVSQKELTDLAKEIPHHVELYKFPRNGKDNDCKLIKDRMEIERNDTFKIGIQIKNSRNELVWHMPQTEQTTAKRFRVVTQLVSFSSVSNDDETSTAPGAVVLPWTTGGQDVYVHDFEQQKDLIALSGRNVDLSQAYYSIYSVNITACGKHQLRVQVIDPDTDRVIFPRQSLTNKDPWEIFHISVPRKKIDKIEIEFFDPVVKHVSLGGVLPPMKLHFKDEDGQDTTFEGELRFEWKTSHGNIGVELWNDGIFSLPIFSFAHEEGSSASFKDQWRVEPRDEGLKNLFPNTSTADPVTTVEVKFFLTVYERDNIIKCDVHAPLTNTKKCFKLPLSPGLPSALMLVHGIQPEYLNDSTIDSLTFEVLDRYGYPTSANYDDKVDDSQPEWHVIFDHCGPIGKTDPVQVRRNGRVIFKNLKLHVDACSLSAASVDQLVYLDRGRVKNVTYEEDETKYLSKLSRDPKTIRENIVFVIKSANRPCTLKLRHEGVLIDEYTTAMAGSTMSDLSFVVLNEYDEEIEFTEQWFESSSNGVSYGYYASWTATASARSKSNKTRSKAASSSKPTTPVINTDCVPDIKFPDVVGEHAYEYTLFMNGASLSCKFTVNTEAGPPHSWCLNVSPEMKAQGVVIGSVTDICSKVLSVSLHDAFGNPVTLSGLVPELFVSFVDPVSHDGDDDNGDEREEKEGAMMMHVVNDVQTRHHDRFQLELLLSEDDNTYVLRPGQVPPIAKSALSIIGSTHVWFQVLTNGTAHVDVMADVQKFALMAGLPEKIFLSISADSSIAELQKESEFAYTLKTTRYTKDAILLGFHDMFDNTPSFSAIKHLKYTVTEECEKSSSSDNERNLIASDFANKRVKNPSQLVPIELDFSWTKNVTILNIVVVYLKKGADEEEITLGPVKLTCELMAVNCVQSLVLAVMSDNFVGKSITPSRPAVSVVAGSDLPVIRVACLTDDGVRVPLTNDSFKMKVTYKSANSSKECVLNEEELFTRVFSERSDGTADSSASSVFAGTNTGYMDLVPVNGERFKTRACALAVELTYIERRVHLKDIRNIPKCSSNITVEIRPAAVESIAFDAKSANKLENAVGSNSENADPKNREIASNVKVYLMDRFNNRVPMSCRDYDILCYIEAAPTDDQSMVTAADALPRLVGAEFPSSSSGGEDDDMTSVAAGAHRHGHSHSPFIRGEHMMVTLEGNSSPGVIFKKLELLPKHGSQSGLYRLVFVFVRQNNNMSVGNMPELPTLSVDLHFETDSDKVNMINETKCRLIAVKNKIVAIEQAMVELKDHLRTIQHNRRSILRQTNFPGGSDASEATQRQQAESQSLNLLPYKASLQSQLQDMQHSSQVAVRAAVKPPRERERVSAGEGAFGQVVDIGCVDDADDARILSWFAREYMNAHIVQTTTQQTKLYRKGLSAWAVDGLMTMSYLVSYTAADGKMKYRNRNQHEILSAELPGMKSLQGAGGDAVYLINLLRLHTKHETLRETVFWNIFNGSILVNTLDDAMSYREYLLKNKQRMPRIITRQGDNVPPNGLLSPFTGKDPQARFDSLQYVFGQLPSQAAEEIKLIQSELNLIEEAIEEEVRIRETEDRINGAEDELIPLKAERDEYKSQLKAFQDEGYCFSQLTPT